MICNKYFDQCIKPNIFWGEHTIKGTSINYMNERYAAMFLLRV